MNHRDEHHTCPACNRTTRHRVTRERVLAPVMWCQTCFHVWVGTAQDRAPTTDHRQAA